MNKSITLRELEIILKTMPKKLYDKNNNSWGDCTVRYAEYIEADELLGYVKEYLKDE